MRELYANRQTSLRLFRHKIVRLETRRSFLVRVAIDAHPLATVPEPLAPRRRLRVGIGQPISCHGTAAGGSNATASARGTTSTAAISSGVM